MKKAIWLIFILQVGILASCAPETSTTPVLETNVPAATASRTPAPTDTHIPSITPTASIKPSHTPTTIIDGVLDLPAWIVDPNVDIAASFYFGPFSLFNAMTGERFDLPFGFDDIYFLDENKQTLYLHSFLDKDNVYLMDVDSGVVSRIPQFNTPTPIFTPTAVHGGFEGNTHIIDTATGEIVYVKKTGEDGQYDQVIRFSPVSALVMILRASSDSYFCDGCDLVIFDPETQTEIAVYPGNYTGPTWSPNGERIAYTLKEIGPHGGSVGEDEICVLEIDNGENQCYQVERHFNFEVSIHHPRWSPDGAQIAFAYKGGVLPRDNSKWGNGGFCLIEVSNGSITCPFDQVAAGVIPELLVDLWVTRVSWSPSGKTILVIHRCPEGCNPTGQPAIPVLVAADGSRYFPLGNQAGDDYWDTHWDTYPDYKALWWWP